MLAGVVFVVADPPEDTGSRPAAVGRPPTDLASLYDPVRAREELPAGFRQLLGRDAIAPIYDPTFVPGTAISWDDDTLVVGVAFGGDAKAYPVSLLNRREMVIDSLAGIPILVTW